MVFKEIIGARFKSLFMSKFQPLLKFRARFNAKQIENEIKLFQENVRESIKKIEEHRVLEVIPQLEEEIEEYKHLALDFEQIEDVLITENLLEAKRLKEIDVKLHRFVVNVEKALKEELKIHPNDEMLKKDYNEITKIHALINREKTILKNNVMEEVSEELTKIKTAVADIGKKGEQALISKLVEFGKKEEAGAFSKVMLRWDVSRFFNEYQHTIGDLKNVKNNLEVVESLIEKIKGTKGEDPKEEKLIYKLLTKKEEESITAFYTHSVNTFFKGYKVNIRLLVLIIGMVEYQDMLLAELMKSKLPTDTREKTVNKLETISKEILEELDYLRKALNTLLSKVSEATATW